jgi:hypothetical protein
MKSHVRKTTEEEVDRAIQEEVVSRSKEGAIYGSAEGDAAPGELREAEPVSAVGDRQSAGHPRLGRRRVENGFDIVVTSPAGGYLRYINVTFKTLVEVEWERKELLRFFAEDNPWRKRLLIRHPDGAITNPDFPELNLPPLAERLAKLEETIRASEGTGS